MTHPRTMIIGSPRSGTTWVAKLFDANPWVLYRHEPDSALPNRAIPGLVDPNDYARFEQAAADYLDRLYRVSTVKTNGGKVRFPKAFRSRVSALSRNLIFYALRATEQLPALRGPVRKVNIPDMVGRRHAAHVYEVAKSVIAGGRAGLYARARPDMRFILVLRHPAGVVASEIRGRSLGKMPGTVPIDALVTTPGAVERGLDQSFFDRAEDIERLSWWWVLFNEKMIADTEGLENCLLVNYDDMCRHPLDSLRMMYAHADIELSDEVAQFLEASTAADRSGADGYFGLFRDPEKASNRWRAELSSDQVSRIRAVTEDTIPGSHFAF